MDPNNIPEPMPATTVSEPLPAMARSGSASRSRPESVSRSRPGSAIRSRPDSASRSRASDDDDNVNDDEKQKKRSMAPPASRPGAVAVSGLSDLDAQATVEAVESDLLIKQRAAAGRPPVSKPGAVSAGGEAMESDAMIKQRAAAGRSTTPVSKPGAVSYVPQSPMVEVAEPGAPVTTASMMIAEEPGAAATTSRTGGNNSMKSDDKKAPIVPASKPGVVSMSGEDDAATVQAVESDMLMKQREKFAVEQPANKPGVVAVVGDLAGSSQAVIQAKEQEDADLRAKQRARPDPAGKSQTSDSDLMVKQRVQPPASRPGVEHGLSTEDSAAVMQSVDADIATKLRVARERSSFSTKDAEAVVQSVDADIAIKQRVARERSSLTAADAEAVVQSYDLDVAFKQSFKSSSSGIVAPGVAKAAGPPPSKTREQMEATMERMEMEQALSKEKSESFQPYQEKSESFGQSHSSLSFSAAPMSNAFSTQDDEYDNPSSKFMVDIGNTKLYLDESGDQEEGGNKDMVEARQIDEDAEREKLPGAEAFDPSQGRHPLYHRPTFIALLLCLVCICIAAIISGVVVAKHRNDDDDYVNNYDGTQVPTVSPTPAPTSSDELFLRYYLDSLIISRATLDQAPVAYDMAVHWYANVDRGRNRSISGSEYPWDLTRFVMAWFYYATSSNGTRPWTSCNPPDYDRGDNETCTFLAYQEAASDRSFINYRQSPNTPRWLSSYDVTQWPGIQSGGMIFDPAAFPEEAAVCNYQVHAIELLGFGLSGPLPYMLNLLPCVFVIVIGWSPDLGGSLEPEFFNFSNGFSRDALQVFNLVNVSGVSGTIPDTFWDLTALQQVVIGDTNLTGNVPDLIFPNRLPSLIELQLFGNNFDGAALPVVSGYDNLSILKLHRNGFQGPIPIEYGYLPQLKELWLFQNSVTGPIPDTFLTNTVMEDFRVYGNQLSGTFPNVLWSNVVRIELKENRFEGPLPATLVNMTSIQQLYVDKNRFNGTLDPEIGNTLLSLQTLSLRDNQLSGPIPASLSNLGSLRQLFLELNNFDGEFPFDTCRLRSRDGLAFVVADCLGYPPQNYCFCCTSCCDSRTRACQTTNVEIAD